MQLRGAQLRTDPHKRAVVASGTVIGIARLTRFQAHERTNRIFQHYRWNAGFWLSAPFRKSAATSNDWTCGAYPPSCSN